MPRLFTPLALIAILAAGAVVRCWHLGGPSLDMDELWSIESSTGHGSMHEQLPVGTIQTSNVSLTDMQNAPPWWTTWDAPPHSAHPPVYRLALHGWINLFGASEAAARSLSVIASLLAILLLFDAVRLSHGPSAGLIAAALMALSGSQIEMAQIARSYALLVCLGVGCCDLLIRIEKLGPTFRRAAALALLITATALTHYFALGALAGLGLYAVIQLRGRALRYALGAFLAAALSSALWAMAFVRQMHGMSSFDPQFLIDNSSDPRAQTLLRLIGLPCKFLGGDRMAGALDPAAYIAVALLVFAIPAISLVRRRRSSTALWFLWTMGTVAMVGGLDLWRHSDYSALQRYTVLASPGMFALLATLDWPPIRAVRIGIPLGLIVAMAAACAVCIHDGTETHEEWRALVQSLDRQAGPNDLLVFFNNDEWEPAGTWYMGYRYYVPHSHRPWLILTRPAGPRLLQQLKSWPVIWFIGKDPEQGSNLLANWYPVRLDNAEMALNGTSAGMFVPMIQTAPTTRP